MGGAVDVAARGAVTAWFSHGARLSPLGRGHINDTWLVNVAGGRFVLQRLSAAVFPRPREVAGKVARVVDHLADDDRAHVPALIRTRTGAEWHEDAQGRVWRLWAFADGTRTLEALTSPAQGEAAGAAFGAFQLALADLPGEVPDPVPGFLRLSHYLAELDAAVADRRPAGDVEAALAVVERRRELASSFTGRDRLIHGDCKVNNLLFCEHTDQVAFVIDLDTVMVGNWVWDFGDLARSAAADGERFSVERFAALARGFVGSGAPGHDHTAELTDALVLAPRYVGLMLGVRFLTDHLQGDVYFKVSRRGQNLQRARGQLALLGDMERREAAMRQAVAGV